MAWHFMGSESATSKASVYRQIPHMSRELLRLISGRLYLLNANIHCLVLLGGF